MASIPLFFANDLPNNWLVRVGSGLSRGRWGTTPLSAIQPATNVVFADFVETTGSGTAGYIRMYPSPASENSATGYAPIPPYSDAETLYIGWDIPEAGPGTYTLSAPVLYQLATVAGMAMAFSASPAAVSAWLLEAITIMNQDPIKGRSPIVIKLARL